MASSFRSVDKGKQRASFKDTTLVLPVVSLANVSQLACDLLIHSLKLNLVGYLSAKAHIPVISPRDYVEGDTPPTGLTLPVEVYQSNDVRLTLIQQRSPVMKARKDDFIQTLRSFVKEEGVSRILLVSGVDAGLRQDFDNPSPLRYLTASNADLGSVLRQFTSPYDPANSELSSSRLPLMPSSGITRRLLASLLEEGQDLQLSALLMFVAEGDNRYDSHLLARALAKALQKDVAEDAWREPVSWKLGLYGTERSRAAGSSAVDIYG